MRSSLRSMNGAAMGRHVRVALAVSVLGIHGCSNAISPVSSESDAPELPLEPDAPELPLCTGSARLALRVFYAGGGLAATGGTVRLENGYPSFAVDGQCRYFMSGGWQSSSGRNEG